MVGATDQSAAQRGDINDQQAAKGWQSRKSQYPNLDVLMQPGEYLLLRLPPTASVPARVQQLVSQPQSLGSDSTQPMFCTVSRTHRELSILLSTPPGFTFSELQAELEPPAAKNEAEGYGTDGPWRALRIRGPMQFHLVGVLLEFSKCLARRSISIFAISTWDTDYICVQRDDFVNACQALREDGWNLLDKAD